MCAKITIFSKCQSAPQSASNFSEGQGKLLPLHIFQYHIGQVSNAYGLGDSGCGYVRVNCIWHRVETRFVVVFLVGCCWSGGRAAGGVKMVSIVIVFFPLLCVMNSELQK